MLSEIAGRLIKVVIPFAKNILTPLGVTIAASATDAVIQTVRSLEYSAILLKSDTKTIETDTKEQKGASLGMLLGVFGASLLGNMFADKNIVRADMVIKEKTRRWSSKSWLWF